MSPGEKCLKLATLRLIADNISFLGGRLDQARIVERAEGCCWSSSPLPGHDAGGQIQITGESGARLAVEGQREFLGRRFSGLQ